MSGNPKRCGETSGPDAYVGEITNSDHANKKQDDHCAIEPARVLALQEHRDLVCETLVTLDTCIYLPGN